MAPVRGCARIVLWRSGRSLAPPASRALSSLESSAVGPRNLALAAASSRARGRPSRRQQIAATAAAFASVSSKEGMLPRPLDEELRGRCSGHFIRFRQAGWVGHREGGDRVLALTPLPSRARGWLRARKGSDREPSRSHLRRRFGHVLEVVEHQKKGLLAQVLAERLDRVNARHFPQAKNL